MATAIIGVGNIGSPLARNLVSGGERVILAAHDKSHADSLANELGEKASSASVEDAVANADAVVFAVHLDVEKELISQLSQALVGKVVIDPSNPIKPGGNPGEFVSSLPEGQSSGSLIASLLPNGAHFVKAFGTLGANDLGAAANRKPKKAVLLYATDDSIGAETAERLIRAAGFEPVKVGGIETSGRIELVGGDLHQHGGLKGKLVDLDEARSLLEHKS